MYQLKEGQIAYILHRVTGVAVILFLFVHLVENFFLLMGRDAYNAAIAIYDTWYFRIGEFALIAAVVYHALNGLRIIVIDFWSRSTKYHKQMWYGVMLLSIILCAWVGKIMLLDYPHWPWMEAATNSTAPHLEVAP